MYLCISEEGIACSLAIWIFLFAHNPHRTPLLFQAPLPCSFFLRLRGDCCKVFIYTHVPCAATPMTTFRSIRLFVCLFVICFVPCVGNLCYSGHAPKLTGQPAGVCTLSEKSIILRQTKMKARNLIITKKNIPNCFDGLCFIRMRSCQLKRFLFPFVFVFLTVSWGMGDKAQKKKSRTIVEAHVPHTHYTHWTTCRIRNVAYL